VRVPDMGNFKDVAIIDVLVKPGEKIEPEAPLVTLETEKATMDVPSTVGGVIEKIHVTKGGTVSTGDLVGTVRQERTAGRAAGDTAVAGDAGAQGAGGAGAGGQGAGAAAQGAVTGAQAAGSGPQGTRAGAQGTGSGSQGAGAGGQGVGVG